MYRFLIFLSLLVVPTISFSGNPPDISGIPPKVGTVGVRYEFKPTAYDPDPGTKLSFVIKNRPSWLSFNYATGEIRGTPTTPGVYKDIIIYAKDGVYTTALPKFTITVDDIAPTPSPTCIRLSWTPPTNNTDGSALTDLQGFKVYVGTTLESLQGRITIVDPAQTTAYIEKPSQEPLYWAMKAYNAEGVHSELSNTVIK